LHTSSPVSYFDFQKRNQQLITIRKDFYTQHEEQREQNSKIIMIGDFNVSPWSVFYKRFAQSFPLFDNITRSQPIFFSWNLAEMLKIHKDFDFFPDWFRNNV
jgi:endonuclease/exonuclease/phosphatase (EEP) superfamily protein YafD